MTIILHDGTKHITAPRTRLAFIKPRKRWYLKVRVKDSGEIQIPVRDVKEVRSGNKKTTVASLG